MNVLLWEKWLPWDLQTLQSLINAKGGQRGVWTWKSAFFVLFLCVTYLITLGAGFHGYVSTNMLSGKKRLIFKCTFCFVFKPLYHSFMYESDLYFVSQKCKRSVLNKKTKSEQFWLKSPWETLAPSLFPSSKPTFSTWKTFLSAFILCVNVCLIQ